MELTENMPALFFEDPDGRYIVVRCTCPKCGQILREKGDVIAYDVGGDGLYTMKLTGWMCTRCGEIQPDWDRV